MRCSTMQQSHDFDLDRERKLDAFELFMTMAKIGKIMNITKFRHEGDSIFRLLKTFFSAYSSFYRSQIVTVQIPQKNSRENGSNMAIMDGDKE